jgi:hypothetical protein
MKVSKKMKISRQMKTVISALILFAAATVAPAADSDKKKADPSPKAVTIPKDAVLNSDGKTYSYTDQEGKQWTYAKTPFGVIKSPAADKTAGARANATTTKAIDKGDTVRFERPSPFGVISWEKKKSDLTDDERRVFYTQNADPKNGDATNADAQNAKTEQK